MGIENYAAFVLSTFLFTITPGFDTILVLNRSLLIGRNAGIFTTLGTNTGILCHTVFAAFGLSFIISQSALAFAVIKYLGAFYLCYMGIIKLFTKNADEVIPSSTMTEQPTGKKSNRDCFVSGLTTNLLNPKVILFFLAFFPQFINKGAINSPLPFFVLGITSAIIGFSWFCTLSVFASAFSSRIMHSRGFKLWLERISGAIFILIGAKIALTEQP